MFHSRRCLRVLYTLYFKNVLVFIKAHLIIGNNYTHLHKASQVALGVKNLPVNVGDIRDTGSIPGLGRSPGGGHGNPLQYSCLENPMDRGGAWQATVHRMPESRDLAHIHMHLQDNNLFLSPLGLSHGDWGASFHNIWDTDLPLWSDHRFGGRCFKEYLVFTNNIFRNWSVFEDENSIFSRL